MFRAYRKHQGRELVHQIYMEDPPPSSSASGLLLQEQLKSLDIHWEENRHYRKLCKRGQLNRTVIKNIFFKRLFRKGKVSCSLCGRDDLFYRRKWNHRYKVGTKQKRGRLDNSSAKNLATIDHIIPLANGGLKYSYSNMMCLCPNCNVIKGARSVLRIGDKYVLNG